MAGIYWNETEGLISLSSDSSAWITIADKNLGATEVYNDGDTLSEANSGKYYQWGNNYGFPFTGAVTTSNTQVNAQNYGPGNYYSSSTFITKSSNWSSVQNDNLWGGETGTVEVMQGPAPTGFHVPSKDEYVALVAAMTALGINTSNGNCMKTYLKMPFAGSRYYFSASVSGQGTYGYYWSANVYNSIYADNLFFGSSQLSPHYSDACANGFSLRCFKNTSVVPDYTWTKLYGDDIPAPKKLKRIVKHNNYYYFGEKPTHASGITLNKNSITLSTAGQTEQLTATITPENAVNKKVLWSSSNTSIATVSSTGLVTFVTPGSCTITCTTADGGITDTCSIETILPITTPGIYHNTEQGLISLSSDGENWITIADKNFGATTVWDGVSSGDNNSSFMGSFNPFGLSTLNMDGFHIPTSNEMSAMNTIGIDINAWTSTQGFTMTSLLRMPGYGYILSNGFRDYGNRYYWTSTSPYNRYGTYFKAANNSIGFVDQNVSDFYMQMLIRPFKNTPVQPDDSWDILYQ